MDHKIISLAILGLVWLAFKLIRMGHRDKHLPPGPPTVPILGNIHLLPMKFPFFRFSEWAKEYGGIISVKVANGTIIVLSDAEIVKELLDGRANETSSRPSFHAMDAITGGNFIPSATSDSRFWRIGRKAIQPLVSPQAVLKYRPVSDTETIQLLHDIVQIPEQIHAHIIRTSFSFITSTVYGKPTPKHDSPEATLFARYIRNFTKAFSPEAAPVDLVPLLKYVPERWAPWKQLWRETRLQQQSLYFSFLEYAEQAYHSGHRSNTFAEDMLDRQVELGISREWIAAICGVMLDGGSETTASFIQTLVLCLIRSPVSMRKAQEEIDKVVGDKRLPVFNDIQDLPYVQAVIKETHRFRPVAPTGVPHATYQDCQFRGYIIPKGSPIIVNMWGIFHDPNLFDRPDEFWPERYLMTPDGTKFGDAKNSNIRASLPFGCGKRICPGMHLANTSIALTLMRLLWAFDFAPINDTIPESTKESIERDYDDGITLTPKPFQCKVVPRSTEKVKIIEESYSTRNV